MPPHWDGECNLHCIAIGFVSSELQLQLKENHQNLTADNMFHTCRSLPRAYLSAAANSLGRLLVLLVKSDHDAWSDLLITTCWQEWWRCWSVDLEKIDQRKTMQNWNWRAPQELHFGRAHIIAFSHKQQTINMWLSYLIIFTLPVIQIAWHVIILCQFITIPNSWKMLY